MTILFRIIALFLLSSVLMASSCQKEDLYPSETAKYQYLFLGHTYNWKDGSRLDPRIERIDLASYEEIWLGGDITAHTTSNRIILDYLNDVFELDQPTRHWALGNHDIMRGNIDWIRETTGRNTFYAHYDKGITRIIIDNFLDRGELYPDTCAMLQRQFDLIKSVTDTINESSHLVLMMHLVTWGDISPGMHTQARANANAPWWRFLCEPNTRFKNIIHPLLQEVRQRGIKVYVISGDGGQRIKQYHHQTADDIHFFISGINNSLDSVTAPQFHGVFSWNPDSVLIFQHDVKARELDWDFVELNGLVD